MKFAFIDAERASFPIERLCRTLGVSVSGYFAWRGRPPSRHDRQDAVLLTHIRSAFSLSNGTYGSPRMVRELQDEGFAAGRHRVARLMRENGLRARMKRRFRRTTDSHHAWPIAPNLLDQDFVAERPNQKWVADISYVWTREGWLYLAVVLDLFSRRVVGWATSDRLHKELALTALRRAIAARGPSFFSSRAFWSHGWRRCRARRCRSRSACRAPRRPRRYPGSRRRAGPSHADPRARRS